MNLFSFVIQGLALVLPWRIRAWLLNNCLGFEIDTKAKIGFSILLSKRVTLSADSKIGHFTFVKGLQNLSLGQAARIGNLNWITAYPLEGRATEGTPFRAELERNPSLVLGRHSAITHRHLIDCSNTVLIGDFSTVAGWGSQIVTHSIDLDTSTQGSRQIEIGSYCFVGTRCVILKGAKLPAHSVLGAGSLLRSYEEFEFSLYSGVPATRVRSLDLNLAYFHRFEGFVS